MVEVVVLLEGLLVFFGNFFHIFFVEKGEFQNKRHEDIPDIGYSSALLDSWKKFEDVFEKDSFFDEMGGEEVFWDLFHVYDETILVDCRDVASFLEDFKGFWNELWEHFEAFSEDSAHHLFAVHVEDLLEVFWEEIFQEVFDFLSNVVFEKGLQFLDLCLEGSLFLRDIFFQFWLHFDHFFYFVVIIILIWVSFFIFFLLAFFIFFFLGWFLLFVQILLNWDCNSTIFLNWFFWLFYFLFAFDVFLLLFGFEFDDSLSIILLWFDAFGKA